MRADEGMGEQKPTVDYDPHSRDYASSSVEMHHRMQSECPVAWSESHDGFWVLARHQDVAHVARDDETFSSDHDLDRSRNGYQGVSIPAPPVRMVPLETDPPEFNAYRRLLNPILSPAAVDRWDGLITDCVTACIDQKIESGEMDLVLDLANPLPAIVTLALLGLPLDDWYRYAEPMHTVVYSPPGTPEYERAAGEQLWIVQQLSDEFRRRKEEPGEGLISTLAHSELVDGEPLSEDDAVAMAYTVMAGGVDTTTALLANALLWLNEHPDERSRLVGDSDAQAIAREEFLRFFSPAQAFARTATTSVDVGGQRICAGERLLLSWAAANRDETVFENPDDLVIDRLPNRHVAFGLGAHRCIGSNLARREIDIVLREVLERMPDYSIAPGDAERYESVGSINGYVRIPAIFDRGPKLGSPLASIFSNQ